jgi:hypothetical protein
VVCVGRYDEEPAWRDNISGVDMGRDNEWRYLAIVSTASLHMVGRISWGLLSISLT